MDPWVIGVDCHARSLTAVRVDGLGRAQGQLTVRNTAAGLGRLLGWGQVEAGERRWAVEGAGGYGLALTRALQAQGEWVADIPGWLTARERRHGARPDKSDAHDALGAARALLRDPALPPARTEDGATLLQLLSDERDALVQERTRLLNRLQAHLELLGGDVRTAVGPLTRRVGAQRALALPLEAPTAVLRARRAQVHRLARRLLAQHAEVAALTHEIQTLVRRIGTSLTDRAGCQALTAARLLAETGDPAHYRRGEASYARYSGTAPRQASSGAHTRHRLDRRGNRQLNAALYRMAITQERQPGSAGQAYTARRVQEGKTAREARRALKRHLANVVFRLIERDLASGRTNFALT